MPLLPDPVQKLINAFEKLPGIGPKTAWRLTFFFLRGQDEAAQQLSEALANLRSGTALCKECFNVTLAGQDLCDVCSSPTRDPATVCVVEEPLDVLVIEQIGSYKGRYHVLHGVLSPIEGVGPDDLKIAALVTRVQRGEIHEVIVATNPSMEGDVTAMYIRKQLAPLGVKISRLARGLPVGGDLEYADQSTLLRALDGREEMKG